ncbi:tetratricopeptide repeat protein [bacterium]|nr:tetratricopeptide repeat protein [bacterium]
MDELTKQGISALKEGKKTVAQTLLKQAVQNNPRNLEAWLWLSGAVSTNQERINCLQKVLEIDPNNQLAAKGIAKLISEGKISLNSVGGGNEVSRPQQSSQDLTNWETQREETKYSASQSREQEIFSVKPSLTPTLISGGIILLVF